MNQSDVLIIGWSKTISGDEHTAMRRPCVYGWFRGNRCLYIGSTGRGYHHLYNHTVIGKLDDILPKDELRFVWMRSLANARTFEKLYINYYQPFFNTNHKIKIS